MYYLITLYKSNIRNNRCIKLLTNNINYAEDLRHQLLNYNNKLKEIYTNNQLANREFCEIIYSIPKELIIDKYNDYNNSIFGYQISKNIYPSLSLNKINKINWNKSINSNNLEKDIIKKDEIFLLNYVYDVDSTSTITHIISYNMLKIE